VKINNDGCVLALKDVRVEYLTRGTFSSDRITIPCTTPENCREGFLWRNNLEMKWNDGTSTSINRALLPPTTSGQYLYTNEPYVYIFKLNPNLARAQLANHEVTGMTVQMSYWTKYLTPAAGSGNTAPSFIFQIRNCHHNHPKTTRDFNNGERWVRFEKVATRGGGSTSFDYTLNHCRELVEIHVTINGKPRNDQMLLAIKDMAVIYNVRGRFGGTVALRCSNEAECSETFIFDRMHPIHWSE
jgi:hypothetical protein